MAENSPTPPPPPPPEVSDTPDLTGYWCYHCDKRVPVEIVTDGDSDVICFECKNGFVESILVSSHAQQVSNEEVPAIGNEFIQVLRMIAQVAREDDEPPPPPSDHHADDNDYLRIELDGWNNDNFINTDEDEQEFRDQVRTRWYFGEDEDDDNDNEHEEQNEIENRNDEQIEIRNDEQIENRNEEIENRIGEQIENRNEEIENRIGGDEDEQHGDDVIRREQRRDVLRLRLRQVASRAANRHHRILDWAEMLMGLEDQSIEFRLQVTGDNDDDDSYVGNPGDYVDAAGYEALLETLAESDITGRRGPPPAAKSAIENLHTVVVNSTCIETCAVCKDEVFNNEGKIVKQLECGHMYHCECIIPWLDSRNTCPVCRFELPTDDPDYEEERKRRLMTMADAATIDHGAVE